MLPHYATLISDRLNEATELIEEIKRITDHPATIGQMAEKLLYINKLCEIWLKGGSTNEIHDLPHRHDVPGRS